MESLGNEVLFMNIQALFCDGTGNYVIPAEPKKNEKILLRFRTAKDDVDQVFLLVGNQSYELEKRETKGVFDYYEIEWQLGEKEFHYAFQICSGGEVKYFNRCGVAGNREDFYSFMITPGFATPGWAKGAVMYQIFVDRFYNGDPTNDVETGEYAYIGEHSAQVKDWSKYPAFMGVREFYGGDLKGVLEKIDYLQELGVEAVYFNPLFVSPSNHKYDIQDYDHIDPHYGVIVEDGGEALPDGCLDNSQAKKYQIRTTNPKNLEASNAFFAELVEEFHKRGIKVIIDGVFNHCGSFNKWLDRERIYESQQGYGKGAYVAEDSPYHNFFRFFKEEWPYNPSYDGWWGHDTLPKLNYEGSEELQEYILKVARKWVSPPYNVDGWRLHRCHMMAHHTDKMVCISPQILPSLITVLLHPGEKPCEWFHKCIVVHNSIPLITLKPFSWIPIMLGKDQRLRIGLLDGYAEFLPELMIKLVGITEICRHIQTPSIHIIRW